VETQIQLVEEANPMKRALAVVEATAILLTLSTLSPSFGASQQLSSAGTETGIAACYGKRLKGHRTSSGQRYNPKALTAAHATIPVGTQVKVTNIENGRSVVVTVNDHMSAHAGGIIMDISQRSCKELGFPRTGEAKVKLEVLGSNGSSKSH
jgi:rare lipoprotein A